MTINKDGHDAWANDSRIAANMERAWFGFFAVHGRLTTVQRAAIPVILEGQDVLICAATASGKTEAACAPLIERLLSMGRQGTIVYITPTRALVNDLFHRLEGPLGALNLQLRRRTGEYTATWNTSPPAVLITTPESLDSLLCRGKLQDERFGHMLARVEAVVLDEIHLLYGTPRGEQVKWLLARLKLLRELSVRKGWHYHGRVQIVGLSATVADPQGVLNEFLPGGTIVQIEGSRTIESIRSHSLREFGHAPIKEHLLSYVAGLTGSEKILVFVPSRKRVDELAVYFRKFLEPMGYEVGAHHASLSRKIREDAEETIRTHKKVVLFTTSTLEIGVDIGDIDIVFLDGPPPDVSSFLQRIGRGNRRSGKTRLYLCAEKPADQLIQEGMLSAARKSRMLSRPPGRHYAVIRQQIASYLFQGPRYRRGHAQVEALFANALDGSQLKLLLNEMVHNEELLESQLGYRLGEYWLDLSSTGSIHSNIESTGGYQVVDEMTGEKLAQGVILRGGKGLSVGGKSMQVKRQKDYTIEVKQRVNDVYSMEGYGYNTGQKVKSDSHALAVRELLSVPDIVWPTLKIGDGRRVIFHLGGPRRAAYIRLIHEIVFPGQSMQVNEFWYISEPMDEHILQERLPTLFQLQDRASVRIDWLERFLGRPMTNKKLPKMLRVNELLSWIRVEDEMEVAARVIFTPGIHEAVLSLFVDVE